jgi:serralysin
MKNYLLLSMCIVVLTSCGEPNNAKTEAQIKKTALIATTGKLWKKGSTINITYKDGSPEIQTEVEKYATEWTKYANINFKFYKTLKDIPKKESADIVITFNTQVNTSAVGTDSKYVSKSDASMNLGILTDKNINTRRSIILHEFGHAIGLEHEHQHKNRTLEFDDSKIIDTCKSRINFTEEMCRMFIIQTIPSNEAYFSQYDLLSIMHYSLHSDFFKTAMEMRANLSLSLTDKVEIAKMYPGRMTADQIIATHEAQEREMQEISTYKNCKLNESITEKMRPTDRGTVELVTIKQLTISSITPGEFEDRYLWEDRESTIIRMQTIPYCNMDEKELEESRAKEKAEKYAKRNLGSCSINIKEDGTPAPSNCRNPKYPFEITKIGAPKAGSTTCYQTFESAYETMKTQQNCR